jgi:hypothetical protein
MDILTEFYADEDHVFVFDNTTTHTARSDSVLSAWNMPKGPKAVGEFWGATVPVLDNDGIKFTSTMRMGSLHGSR